MRHAAIGAPLRSRRRSQARAVEKFKAPDFTGFTGSMKWQESRSGSFQSVGGQRSFPKSAGAPVSSTSAPSRLPGGRGADSACWRVELDPGHQEGGE